MEVKLYQINLDRDEEGRVFLGQDWLSKKVDDPTKIDSSIYDCVFDGEIDGSTLEDAFATFNFDHPDGFKGRSMSVSDVLVTELEDGKLAAYFCDSIGFTHVDFDMDAAKALSQDITVVILEPGKMARVGTIDGSLAGMQKFVGGYIEAFYPFEEPVCIVCNGLCATLKGYNAISIVIWNISGVFCSIDCNGIGNALIPPLPIPTCIYGR